MKHTFIFVKKKKILPALMSLWKCLVCIYFTVPSDNLTLVFFPMALQPNIGQGHLILDEVSRSHTTRTTVGRNPLDEWSARRRDLYLTTHNTHNRQTSMPPAGFEPRVSAGERPQTYALDGAATGTDIYVTLVTYDKNLYKLPFLILLQFLFC